MNSLGKILTIGSYAIVSIILAALLPGLTGVSTSLALLTGGVVFLCCAILHLRWESGNEIERLNRVISDIKHGQTELRTDVDLASRDVSRLGETIGALDLKSHKEIVNEMRVLEALLARIAQKRQSEDATEDPESGGASPPSAPSAPPPVSLRVQRLAAGKSEITLAALNEALEESRIDLYLQPIVSLPQRKVRFYEGYSRLRDRNGAVIEPAQYIGVAEEAGIVSTIDNFLLLRCVQLIRRMHLRNRNAIIFCNISSHSLRDQGFFPQFVDFMEQNSDLAGSMVFEFSQAAVQENTLLEWRQLARLSKLGYRLSMDNLTHLDIDLEELSKRRFAFIKISAETLLHGMEQARSRFLSTDIKPAMRRYGIDLIAEKIEDETEVLNLLDFELDFGQGYLFGEPRRSRGEEEDISIPARLAARTA
ncbi:MAG TPA: hypothetical protein DCO82_09390 [Alphaproteobacteria bacterium]|jgi:cyclic-di-GMP phosphodiesterase, flagellum assembly factor TipF|nr:hypothetical protein [Alphaproteobacteria bacterium]